ncbi:MAG: hydroxyacid dehydrogenase [Labrys sp. (in: a-proteobacteria)]
MARPRILVVGKIHGDGVARLAAADVETQYLDQADEATVAAAAREADAILLRTSRLSAEAIAAATRLRVVSRHGVGYDNVDLDAMNRAGIPLTIVGPVNAVSVAEQTMFLILAAMKQGIAYDKATREGRWGFRDSLRAGEVAGKTLLVIGYGRIGRAVARIARAFDMQIAAFDPFQAAPAEDGLRWFTSLPEALAIADVVTLHVPLTAQTRHLIDAAALAQMKPGAVVICTARGGIVDEEALADALVAGRLRGAGLDVFAEEPFPAGHRLAALDSVVLSPHSAALTEECAARMASVAAENCLDGLAGRLDPGLVVNPQVLKQGG